MVENDSKTSACPVKHSEVAPDTKNGCPVQGSPSSNGIWQWITSIAIRPDSSSVSNRKDKVNMSGQDVYNPKTNDYIFDSKKNDSQMKVLNTVRSISTIPKDEFTPSHQPESVTKWVYPSEQQYFNAIKKKGYEAREDDIPVVLAIHNFVNEEGINNKYMSYL